MGLIQFAWKMYLRVLNPTCKIRASSLSRNVHFEKRVTIEQGSHIQCSHIGKYTYINKYCLIDKSTESIGRFCSIAYNVRIGLGSHPVDWISTHSFVYDKKYGFNTKNRFVSNEKTIVGNDVWIGANATILNGVTIGDGAIIGAHSLVTKDVEPYSIVVGVPAKVIRYRFDKDTIQKLLAIKWWNWQDDLIMKKIGTFTNVNSFLESAKD